MTQSTLIVYYSHSGNTEKIASLIQEVVGGTLHRIEEKNSYPREYDAVLEQAKKELKAGYLPPLASHVDDLASYDTIFIGSPNWWSSIAPPAAAFLSENELAGKTIVPFFTHGGGGSGHMQSEVNKLCSDAKVLKGFATYGSGPGNVKAEIRNWLQSLPINLQ